MDFEELETQALDYWHAAVEYLSHPELLFQLGLIALLFVAVTRRPQPEGAAPPARVAGPLTTSSVRSALAVLLALILAVPAIVAVLMEAQSTRAWMDWPRRKPPTELATLVWKSRISGA